MVESLSWIAPLKAPASAQVHSVRPWSSEGSTACVRQPPPAPRHPRAAARRPSEKFRSTRSAVSRRAEAPPAAGRIRSCCNAPKVIPGAPSIRAIEPALLPILDCIQREMINVQPSFPQTDEARLHGRSRLCRHAAAGGCVFGRRPSCLLRERRTQRIGSTLRTAAMSGCCPRSAPRPPPAAPQSAGARHGVEPRPNRSRSGAWRGIHSRSRRQQLPARRLPRRHAEEMKPVGWVEQREIHGDCK